MAKKRPMKLEDLFKFKAVGTVAISPDGTRVAFELKRLDYEKNKNFVNIMLADVAGGRVRKLTRGDHVDTCPRWSRNGRKLGFLSDRDKGQTLWVLDMAGGEPTRVTEPDGIVSDFDFSPDGRRVVYAYKPMNEREKLERDGKKDDIAKMPQFKRIKRVFHKLDGAGFWNGNYTHIHVAGLGGGKPKQLTRGDYDDSEPRFSPDGRRVSFISNRVDNPDMNVDNADIYVVKPTGGPIKKITRMQGSSRGHAWSPDGRYIAYIGNPTKPGQGLKHLERVWLVPSSGGKPAELTRDIDNGCFNDTVGDVAFSFFDATPPIWSADSARLYFPVSENGATHFYSRSISRKDTRCVVDGPLNIYQAQRTAAGGPIAMAIGTATNPGDVYVFDPDTGNDPQRVTHVNADVLKRIHVGEPERFEIKSGGHTIEGWLLKPPNFKANKKYPAILEVHGGPMAQYGYSMFHEMQWMAARGYVVAYGNPRGSSGYGLKFMNCIEHDWGDLDYKDVVRIADYLFSRRYVDRTRVGVTGGSYGGYMTNWLVGHTNRFKAAVTQRSVVNLESFWGTSDFGYVPGWLGKRHPWEDRQGFRKQSPLTHVKHMKTPLLIIHSEQDLRCPVAQAEELFASLKVLGCETELLRFEGESHGLSRGGRPQNRAERLRAIMGWMDKYLAK